MGSATSVKPRAIGAELVAWTRFGVVTVLLFALYAEILTDLAREWWTRPEASYGMLVPPFALYLAYLRRAKTRLIPILPDVRGLGLVALACLTLLSGKLASEFFLCRISFTLMLAGLAWTFWGVRRLRSLAFSLSLLTTMVPIPGILYNTAAAPLQLFASRVATQLAQMLGITVFRDGNVIHLASISLGVAEACSGLHSLSALMVASLVLGFLENLSTLGKLLIFTVSVPLAIMVNVCRVTGTAILADSRPELAMDYYHAFSSWLVFLIGFGILWMVTKLIFRFSRSAVS